MESEEHRGRHGGRREEVEASARATERLRQQTYVGVSKKSLAHAFDNAWEVAKRDGVEPGTRFTIVEQSAVGYNPFTDFHIVMIPGGT